MIGSPATPSRPPSRWRPVLGIVAALALAAACGGTPATAVPSGVGAGGSTDQPVATVLRAATLLPGQAIPAPTGKAVLTFTGLVAAKNHGSSIVLDQAMIDRLGQVQVTVYEPWLKQDVTFRGVWLADLLKVVAATPATAALRLTALDDYRVALTATDIRAGGIMLATKAGDGAAIPVSDGGPTRIVFVKDIKSGANADQWIWSLKTIEIQ
jgi:hypothetical protein